MGSPRQTFAGETRLSRQCRWPRAAKGRSASHFKNPTPVIVRRLLFSWELTMMYPGLLEQPRPCLSNPINQGGRGEGGGHRGGAWDSLLHPPSPRNIYFTPKKIWPHPTQPNPSPTTSSPRSSICRRLSFKIKPFKKTETFQEEEEGEDDLKPCFTF